MPELDGPSSGGLEDEIQKGPGGGRSRTLFARDADYLRDVALFWPFVFYSVWAVGCAFSPPLRQLGLRCAVVAIAAILLAKEKLLLFFVALGFIATQCAITLILHRWNWVVFAVGMATLIPFLVANRYWRKPRLSYRVPDEFRLVDALWCVASICGMLLLAYAITPYR